jgi:hypothetical protein
MPREQEQRPDISPEYARDRLANDPTLAGPHPDPNYRGEIPGWTPETEAREREYVQLKRAAQEDPGTQEQRILTERGAAAYNGQENPGYGQVGQFASVHMAPVMRMQPQLSAGIDQPVSDTEAVRPAISVLPPGNPRGNPRAVQDPDTGKVEIPEPGLYRPSQPMTQASAEQAQAV